MKVQPTILRVFWDMVSRTNPQQVLPMDDEHLKRWLVDRVQESSFLDRSQCHDLGRYIHDRMPLIRDIVMGHS